MNKPIKTLLAILTTTILTFTATTSAQQVNIEFLTNKVPSAKKLPFSEAVRVDSTLYLSGQIGLVPSTATLASGGIKAETKQTLENIKRTLEKHNYSMNDVVKCTVMLANMADFKVFNQVYASYFSKPYPARSTFGANGLALNAKIEIECMAVKGNNNR